MRASGPGTWGLQFLRERTPARTRHNIRQIVQLGTYSRSMLEQLRRDTGKPQSLAVNTVKTPV